MASPDIGIPADAILQAAAEHDVLSLKHLLLSIPTTEPANVRDADGQAPLHVAIAACDPTLRLQDSQGAREPQDIDRSDATTSTPEDVGPAMATVQLLLDNGAIWNELDQNNETPGCIARRLGLNELYQIMVAAGVRAEMLLSRLDDYIPLDEKDEESLEQPVSGKEEPSEKPGHDDPQMSSHVAKSPMEQASSTSHREPMRLDEPNGPHLGGAKLEENESFLKSKLRFSGETTLVNSRDNLGVMMSWETKIMERSVEKLIGKESGLRFLNIGHGLGIIDKIIQSKNPSSHYIIEAHSDVLRKMHEQVWPAKPGVVVCEGRWQDVVPRLFEEGLMFDAIYFDTYAEDYRALRDFFETHVRALLSDNGKFGFFNGLGADRQICYDVYCQIVEMDLIESGFEVEFYPIDTSTMTSSETWQGLARSYWRLEVYRLPVVQFPSSWR